MGFFSSIWKGITSVFTGIMKVFSPILEPLGRILNTGWAKAIMLAMSVFTMGASLLAGGQTFMSTAGSFVDKFVAGGKTFLTEALGIEFKGAAEQMGTAAEVGVQAGSGGVAADIAAGQAVNPGDLMAANIPGGEAVGQAGSMAMGPPATGDVMRQATTGGGGAAGSGAIPGMTPGAPGTPPPGTTLPPDPSVLPGGIDPAGTSTKAMTGMAAKPTAAAPQGFGTPIKKEAGWLTKAANKAWEWANTDLGSEIIGGAMEGYYQGKRDDAYYAEQRRIDDMWRNPNDPGRIGIESSRERTARFSPARGLAGAPAIYANRISQGAIENYAPSVPFIGGGG